MSDDSIGFVVFAVVGGAVVLYFLSRVLRFGGFRAAMFGARIGHTVGEVYGSAGKWMGTTLRVHTLEGSEDGRAVGLEIVSKGPGSYSMSPLSLSAVEATKLVTLLQSALGNKR